VGFAQSVHPWPFMRKVFALTFDGSDGTIEFDGHYYVGDPESPRQGRKNLPTTEFLLVKKEGEERECDMYVVEIMRRETLDCTDVISEVEDEGGGKMNVCFFPTDRQRLYFRVLEKNPTHKRYEQLRAALRE
jgi:hypothetical protein